MYPNQIKNLSEEEFKKEFDKRVARMNERLDALNKCIEEIKRQNERKKNISEMDEVDDGDNNDDNSDNIPKDTDESEVSIEKFTRNLTKIAATIGFDPFLGRTSELNQIISILIRKKKNNVILLGEPGVGKTAIIEGLTTLIYQKSPKIPKSLYTKEVYEINVGALTAGAKYRGEFEERIELILQWMKKQSNIILFIDEAHVLLGGVNFNVSNYLKPALARSDFLCIGATTEDEFEQYIAKDKALLRRFKIIKVNPLSKEATLKVLFKMKQEYEDHYGIKLSKGVFNEVIDLSELYIKDQFLPDKAIDLLDLSCSQFYLKSEAKKRKWNILKSKSIVEKSFWQDSSFTVFEKKNVKNVLYFLDKFKKNRSSKDFILNPIFYQFYILSKHSFLNSQFYFSRGLNNQLKIKKNAIVLENLLNNNLVYDIHHNVEYKEIIRYLSYVYFKQVYSINIFYRHLKSILNQKKVFYFRNLYNLGSIIGYLNFIGEFDFKKESEEIKTLIDPVIKAEYIKKVKTSSIDYKALSLENLLSKFYFLDLLEITQNLRLSSKESQFKKKPIMSASFIGKVLSSFIKIPINPLYSSNNKNLITKQNKTFNSQIFGQPHVLKTVLNTIKKSYTGIRDMNRPISSFFFAGPTGVGKTEVAKVLAEILFGDRKKLTIIDMSDYPLSESISKLIGTSPGYVGYDQGGLLTDQVRKHPYSIIVFDEIEKAAKSIYNIFLQILEEGRLVDNKKRSIDFTNTIIIFTSNIGANLIISHHERLEKYRLKLLKDKLSSVLISKEKRLKFFRYLTSPVLIKFIQSLDWQDIVNSPVLLQQLQPYFDYLITDSQFVRNSPKLNKEIRLLLFKNFRPEIVNRIDHILIFNCLTKNNIRQILDLLLLKLAEKIYQEYSLLISCSASFCNYLVNKGYDLELGARPIRRILSEEVESRITEYLVEFNIRRSYNGTKRIKLTRDTGLSAVNSFGINYLKNKYFYRIDLLKVLSKSNEFIFATLLRSNFSKDFFTFLLKTDFNNRGFSHMQWNFYFDKKLKREKLLNLLSRSVHNKEFCLMSDLGRSINSLSYIGHLVKQKSWFI